MPLLRVIQKTYKLQFIEETEMNIKARFALFLKTLRRASRLFFKH